MNSVAISITPMLPPKLDSQGNVVEQTRPAPYILTSDEAARLLRVDHLNDPNDWLYRRRREGKLRGFGNGREVRYLLPSVIEFAQEQEDKKPR